VLLKNWSQYRRGADGVGFAQFEDGDGERVSGVGALVRGVVQVEHPEGVVIARKAEMSQDVKGFDGTQAGVPAGPSIGALVCTVGDVVVVGEALSGVVQGAQVEVVVFAHLEFGE
jgi:hypothetical protein